MTKDEFKQQIKSLSAYNDIISFADKILANDDIWFFKKYFNENASYKYNEFKYYMSQKFGINPQEITIIGSARFGFSMNPQKNYKDFNENSDIDIVIVSKKLFEKLWDDLLVNFTENDNGLSYKYKDVCRNVFKRFIDTERYPEYLTTKNEKWFQQVAGYKKDLQIDYMFPEEIGYRIFRSWEDFKLYLIKNIKNLKMIGVENEGN